MKQLQMFNANIQSKSNELVEEIVIEYLMKSIFPRFRFRININKWLKFYRWIIKRKFIPKINKSKIYKNESIRWFSKSFVEYFSSSHWILSNFQDGHKDEIFHLQEINQILHTRMDEMNQKTVKICEFHDCSNGILFRLKLIRMKFKLDRWKSIFERRKTNDWNMLIINWTNKWSQLHLESLRFYSSISDEPRTRNREINNTQSFIGKSNQWYEHWSSKANGSNTWTISQANQWLCKTISRESSMKISDGDSSV